MCRSQWLDGRSDQPTRHDNSQGVDSRNSVVRARGPRQGGASRSRERTRISGISQGGVLQTKSVTRVVAIALVGALALAACAKDGDSGGGGGASSKSLVVASDLPLQGAGATQWQDTNKLIQLYLDQQGSKAGDYSVRLKIYDDSN